MAASFIKNEQGLRELILGIMHGRITGKVQSLLQGLDQGVSDIEQLVYGSTAINVNGTPGKIHISKEDLREHLQDNLFNELTAIAVKGRTLLQELGYESKSKVAPSVLLGKDPMSASVMATPYEVTNPGEPPLQGVKVSSFGKSQNTDNQ